MYVHTLPNPPPGSRFAAIATFLRDFGEPAYRFRQVVHAAHQRGIAEFAAIDELPLRLRHRLTERFGATIHPLQPVISQRGDQVEKVLFVAPDGVRLETIRSSYRAGWTSLCVSTQAGCGLGCTFCATGAVGLVRNLTADEICAQVGHPYWSGGDADSGPGGDAGGGSIDDHRSIAFMGMGEALANPHIFPALQMLTDPSFHGLSERRITVSTVGFAPNLARLVREHPRATVTLSVHSPFSAQRGKLIPLHDRFPLSDNLDILDAHVARARRRVYLAYVLIAGVNDSPEHLRGLTELVHARSVPRLFQISVIGYNRATGIRADYRAPSQGAVEAFVAGLRHAGVRATKRQQFGATIDAACGQLHARYLGYDADTSTRPVRLPDPTRRSDVG